jgi:hypothetical protein
MPYTTAARPVEWGIEMPTRLFMMAYTVRKSYESAASPIGDNADPAHHLPRERLDTPDAHRDASLKQRRYYVLTPKKRLADDRSGRQP